ncbi:hypothetical protein F8M41_025375 [Gigaspora margarita]|uniref:Transmembrane protein n=1 Tax=Gigaspora margarita TaxID=4874 RepID=A0A8H3XKB7_GIGMA|nr:hypothetical protein F8M41_025375 [Gigaspora margarita]
MSNEKYPQSQQNVYQEQGIPEQIQQQTTYSQPQYVAQEQMQQIVIIQEQMQQEIITQEQMQQVVITKKESISQMPVNEWKHSLLGKGAIKLSILTCFCPCVTYGLIKSKMNGISPIGYGLLYYVSMHFGFNYLLGCLNRGEICSKHNIRIK